jgi:Protein of unknown function (DUF3349)
MAAPRFLASIIDWLRAGYPEGVPEHDYLPLFALLARKLTHDEVATVAEQLVADGRHSPEAVKAAISNVTNETPLDGDVARVAARLASGGWPLAEPPRDAAVG